MARLAIAATVLSGLLALPALAWGDAKGYRGTLVVDQRPLPGAVPAGSSLTYRFHARYSISGHRQKPYGRQRGPVYSLGGPGNQTLEYKVDLRATDSTGTHSHVADWHGSGRWTRHSGQVAILNVFRGRYALRVDLGFSPKSLPLSVSSEQTDVFTSEDGTCVHRDGLDGPRIWVEDPCEDRFQSLPIPKGTAVTPYSLLSEGDPSFRDCGGPRVGIRNFNGWCGTAQRNGRIRSTHRNVWPHPRDYPFIPWKDQRAASDAQEAAGLFYGAGLWGEFAVRTTYKLDITPVGG